MLFQESIELPMPDAKVVYFPALFDASESNALLQQLINEIAWRQDDIRMFGKWIPQPRLTAWYGDAGKSYKYSGITMQPMPWLPVLLDIKARIEPLSGTVYNSVLLNYYRGGSDSMSWHADDEPELGVNPVIGSVSFGAERTFHFRHNATQTKQHLVLEHGSFLLMAGPTQHHWQHQIPKTQRAIGERINLTFRVIQ
jgi:alkylated DNA repair dioxygenase AlkB